MYRDPGRVPAAGELALISAAQLVITELNARLDRFDIEGALDLYADDAVLEAVQGRDAIRQTIMHSGAAGSKRRACHVVSNVRAVTDEDAVVVDCTQVAYLLEGPPPYPANIILEVHYVLRPSADGSLRIVEQRIPGYHLTYG
jgi:hypothetical protein